MIVDSSSKLCIISQNVNGFGNLVKRAQILAHLELYKPDILFLNDTRLGKSGQDSFVNQHLDYLFFFNSSSSQSRGVDILIKKSCPLDVISSWGDIEGNILILNCNFDGEQIILCNVYGPNRDRPLFFSNLFDKLNDYGANHVVIGGDWNVPLNPNVDCYNYNNIRMNGARRTILDALDNGGFCDPFRLMNGDKKDFTWERFGGGAQAARLDYFLVTSVSFKFVSLSHSFHKYRSDHKPILLTIDFKKVTRGPGYFKFDNNLLLDEEFFNLAQAELKTTCAKYLDHPIYENFLNEAPVEDIDIFINAPLKDLEQLDFVIDYDTLLIMIFNDIKNLAISYTAGRNKSNSYKAKKLLEKINSSIAGPQKEEYIEAYNNLIECLANEKLSKIAKLSKLQGEKPTKWFLRLEKYSNDQKFLGELINGDGISITAQTDIELEIRDFFKSLYSDSGRGVALGDDFSSFLPPNYNAPKLTLAQANSLEGDITLDEISEFLKKVNDCSTPGFTGITYKFIKRFFIPLGSFLVRAAKDIFRKGIFPPPMRTGIISLLPKGKKDKRCLQNWRPICLLDCVYKIFSGVLTQRINTVLHLIIANTQSGFIPGRTMNDSLRLLTDVLEWGKNFQQGGVILNIDFKKAFDTVSFNFIHNSLTFFGFKENFIKWIGITQNQFQVCTSNSGNIAPPFYLSRGVKQGDPISPALFVISLEILSLKIRNDTLIKGYKMGTFEVKQSYFADDSIFILDRNETSIKKAVEALDSFAELSGLFINKDKSSLIEFGIRPGYNFCPEIPFKRVKEFVYLGFNFTWNLADMEKNIEEKLEEIDKIAKNWVNKNLSIYGRNIIAKTLMLSKINNIILILPNLKKKVLNRFESVVYDFLWQGKDKVKRGDAKIGELQGGLNLPNISTSVEAFKIQWFRRLFTAEPIWSGILNEYLKRCVRRVSIDFHYLLKLGDLGWIKVATKIESNFWKICLKATVAPHRTWIKQNPLLLLDTCIWNNSLLKNGNSTFSPWNYPTLKNKIFFVSDLVNQGTKCLYTYDEFSQAYGPVNIQKFSNIIIAVRNILFTNRLDLQNISIFSPRRSLWQFFFTLSTKGCRSWTRLLRTYRTDNIRIREDLWEGKLNKRLGPDFWDKTYRLHSTITFNNRIKWFQYKINRGALTTNSVLCYFKPNITDRCTFCLTGKEDILHLFWNCPFVQQFFISLTPYINTLAVTWPPNSRESFLFGDHSSTFLSETGYIFLMIKHFIWVSRCLKNDLSLANFKSKLVSNISLDLYFLGRGEGGEGEGTRNVYGFIGTLANKIGIG